MTRIPHHHTHIGWCGEHGKRLFTSRKSARRAARNLHGPALREYRCTMHEGWWHFGHLPQATRVGLLTTTEVYGADS